MKIIGLSGSLRAGSYNTALLYAAKDQMKDQIDMQVFTIHDIPLYDGDKEALEGLPPRVVELKEAIINSDGLFIVTPEYNHSIPGVLKNAIDWLSRPPKDIQRVFGGLPVALMGASPSSFGTVLAQEAWLPVFRTLGTKPWFGKSLHVSNADKVFDATGKLTDPAIALQLRQYMQGFVSFINLQQIEVRVSKKTQGEERRPSVH